MIPYRTIKNGLRCVAYLFLLAATSCGGLPPPTTLQVPPKALPTVIAGQNQLPPTALPMPDATQVFPPGELAGAAPSVPTSISLPHRLSDYADPIQDQVRYSITGGGAPPPFCPELSADTAPTKVAFTGPMTWPTRAYLICFGLLSQLRSGSLVKFDLIRPDRQQDNVSYRVEVPEGSPDTSSTRTFVQIAERTIDGRPRFSYIGQVDPNDAGYEGYMFSALYRRGDPLGVYTVVLTVDGTEIASDDLEVGLCDCPEMHVALRSHPDDRSNFLTGILPGDILALEFTGFRSYEHVQVAMIEDRDRAFSLGQIRYSWTVEMDAQGDAYDAVVLDQDLSQSSGQFIIAHSLQIQQRGEENRIFWMGLADVATIQIAGVTSPTDMPEQPPTSGMRVVGVEPDSPAAKAGFQVGDILISLNDQPVHNVEEIRGIIAQNRNLPIAALVWNGVAETTLIITPLDGPIGVDLCELSRCP